MTTPRRAAILLAHDRELRLFDDGHRARLAQAGELLNTEPIDDWSDEAATELLERCTVLCTHWGCPPIDDAVLTAAPHLALIAHAAGSVKHIVGAAVWERGIRVTSGAAANAEPVAQFTLAAILFAGKGVPWRANSTDPLEPRAAMTLVSPVGNYDTTIGIIGASLIGRRVIGLLSNFDHLDVVVYDPFLTDDDAAALGVRKVDLLTLCACSDIVSIHAPALAATHHMIDETALATMHDGATVINTARGSLVDHDALAAHVRRGRLRAVLDVTDPEPLPADHPLRTLPTVLLTPHLAGSQGRELVRLAEGAIDEIERWTAGEPALHEVTREALGRIA